MLERLMLIVTSKLKQTIKSKADMNTSAGAGEELNKHIHNVIDKAISNAKSDGRKTVMDRDITTVLAYGQMSFSEETAAAHPMMKD